MPEPCPARRQDACCRRIYDLVREIPPGKVMTYGQLAELTADVCPSAVPAVTVGRIMAGSGRSAPDLPWWRVIGKEGAYGVLRKRRNRSLQRDLLAREGVLADREGRYELSAYQYLPPSSSSHSLTQRAGTQMSPDVPR